MLVETNNHKATFIMMVGIPASGKSYVAEQIQKDGKEEGRDVVIHSSDKLREEMFGDVMDQEHNNELFQELHRRIKSDLRNGKAVIYDATNINKKRRAGFLRELNGIECEKICVPVLTPYEDCIERNRNRDRNVPDNVIERMYKNFQPPYTNEGFDSIILIYNLESIGHFRDYTIEEFFHGKVNACEIDQENHHHSKTIGDHCIAVYQDLTTKYPHDPTLIVAGLLHDCGKPFCKTNRKPNGEIDTEYHYYSHDSVGAYDSFFYTMAMDIPYDARIDIANIIYYHMLPMTAWKQSAKAKSRTKRQVGDEMFDWIIKLNKADKENS